jgi:DNA-binding response OmpR family regulator
MHWPCARGERSRWRVLVAIDSGRDVTGVAQALRVAGLYDVEECEAELSMLKLEDHDLMIMVDAGAPRRVLERLLSARGRYRDKPIFVLSNDPAPELAAACLHAGANDFVPVPFIGYELLQRVYNWLSVGHLSPNVASARQSGFRLKTVKAGSKTSAAIHLNENDFTVTIDGLANNLTEMTFRVVEYLVQRAGTWVRSPELQLKAIGAHATPGASNVRFHVHKAREQFQFGDFARYLHSWPKRGYMWSFERCDTPHCQMAHEGTDRLDVRRSRSARALLPDRPTLPRKCLQRRRLKSR